MSAAAAPVELRPMGIGDILDAIFRLYKTYFVPFVIIALVAYVPFALYTLVIGLMTGTPSPVVTPAYGPEGTVAVAPAATGTLIASFIGLLLFVIIVLPLAQAALIYAISRGLLGEEVSAVAAFSQAKSRLLPLLGTQFLVGIIVMVGILLLIVPGIIFSLWFMIVAPVVVLERVGGTQALGRSRELMRDNLGKGFALLFVVNILVAVIEFGAQTVLGILPLPFVLLQVCLLLVQAVMLPIQTAPLILLYYDLRIRKEAFDLERLAESMQGQPQVAMA